MKIVDRLGNIIPHPHRHQAHGLSHCQMEDLRLKQQQGVQVEMMPANNAGDSLRDQYFQQYKDLQIPRHESHLFHVACDARNFDSKTGVKLSIVTYEKFTPEAYEFMKSNFGFSGKIIHILHNPELPEHQ